MEARGGITDNLDGSKNLNLGLVGDNGSASAFVNGMKSKVHPRPTETYGAAGGNITLGSEAANVGLTATHIPRAANQLTASANATILHSGSHKVDVNTFATKTFQNGPGPNFTTHGAGANYSYNDTFRAGASVAHTPMFKHTEQSISAGVNLMKTPTSSLSLNAGMNRSQNPFQNSGWQPSGATIFRKQF